MSIEQEIHQDKFESEHQRLHINILYTAAWLDNQMEEILEPFDLTPEQFNVLRILRGAGKIVNLKYVSDRLINRQSNTSRLIDKLFLKKLVNRSVSKNDRRNIEIFINEKGMELIQVASLKVRELNESLKGIKIKEAKEISDALDRLREIRNR